MSDVTAGADVEVRTNPYVGPRSLRFGERVHGRDRELDQLRDAVVADRIVLLYSPSGAGKSSLLEAGLRPALEARGFFVAPTIRVSQDVAGNRYALSAMLSLEEALPAERRRGSEALSALTLAQYVSGEALSSLHPDKEICLIFDQFEEVFTLDPVDIAAKALFFEQLGELLRDRSVWVVIAMREDYIARLDPYLETFPRRLATRLRLDFLDERAALAAVRNPAATMGVQFTDEAAHALVDDLRTVIVTRGGAPTRMAGPYVEPVQLQVVCSQLWSRLPPTVTMVTKEDIEHYADTDNALAHFYTDQVAHVAATTSTSERSIRDWFEQRLITPNGFRAQTFDFPGAHGLDVLDALEDAYLIRADSRRGVKWYELTHDRMIAPVLEGNAAWREASLSPLQKRAVEWDAKDRPDGLLVTGGILAEGESWLSESPDATEVERDFFLAARRYEDAAQADLERHRTEIKRARRRSFIFAGLAILALAGLIVATIKTLDARESESAAKRSEQGARDSEEKAKLSEQEARDSEEKAKLSALEARDSEEKAQDSEREAKASEEKAQDSEREAKASEEKARQEKDRTLESLFKGLVLNVGAGNAGSICVRASADCVFGREIPGLESSSSPPAVVTVLAEFKDDVPFLGGAGPTSTSRVFVIASEWGRGRVIGYAQDGLIRDEQMLPPTPKADNLTFVDNAIRWTADPVGCDPGVVSVAIYEEFETLENTQEIAGLLVNRGWRYDRLDLGQPLAPQLSCVDTLVWGNPWENATDEQLRDVMEYVRGGGGLVLGGLGWSWELYSVNPRMEDYPANRLAATLGFAFSSDAFISGASVRVLPASGSSPT